MPVDQGRSWGHRPIWRYLALGVFLLVAGYVGYRVFTSRGQAGDSCEKNLDCRSRICLFEKGRNLHYCTRRCATDEDCQTGWKCLTSPDFVYRKVCIQP